MPLVKCPDCGARVSDAARVCAKCGFPMRPGVVAQQATVGLRGRAPEGYGFSIVIGVVVAVLLLLAGLFAAFAVPRYRAASHAAKEAEGERLLTQVYELQNTYWSRHSAYASNLEQLGSVGWKAPDRLRYYTVEIASSDPVGLCLHALPRPGAGVRPIRMRSAGVPEPGARCDGYGGDSTTVAADAKRALREVYRGLLEWRYEHKRLPENEAELAEASPSAAHDRAWVIGLTPMQFGGLCVHLAPRTQPPSTVTFSMDGGGNVYAGDGCAGARIR